MKNIAWITADYFLDFDIPLLKELAKQYQIEWYVLFPVNINVDKEYFLKYGIQHNIEIVIVPLPKRQISIANVLIYLKMFWRLKKKNPSIIYFNLVGFPYFHLLAYIILNKGKKIIHAAHNVIDYKGWQYRKLMKLYTSFVFSFYKNIHLFSEYLESYFNKKYKNKNTLFTPLALTEYGESQKYPEGNRIKLLFFGNVKSNKRLDVLIKAIQQLGDELTNRVHLTIVGQCNNPDQYLNLIYKPDLFSINFIRLHSSEVADLFCSNHYLVLPYENVAQSGPHMIAYSYNIPVIASDIEGFRERIKDNENGFLFKVNDVIDLQRVLKNVIESHDDNYKRIKSNLSMFAKENYSIERIAQKYKKYFDKIINENEKV
jgi:glycosyltransferase involved in cell wall biosynthesis